MRELWEFHRRLGDLFDRNEATLFQCIFMFQSAWRLESLQSRGEGLEEIRIFDLLERGRKAAARARSLFEEAGAKERQGWQDWMLKSEAEFLNVYSTYLRDAKRFDEALDLLDASEALGCESVYPITYLWRASVERMRGNYEKCMEYFDEARQHANRIEEEGDLIDFNMDLAFENYRYYTDIGVLELASWWLEKGREAARIRGHDSAQEWALLHKVSFLNALDRYSEAAELAMEALDAEWISPIGADRLRFNQAFAKAELTRREDLFEDKRQAYLSEARSLLEGLLEKGSLTLRDDYLATLTLARVELDAGNHEAAARWLEHAEKMQAVGRSGEAIAGGSARSYLLSALKARLLIDTDASSDRLRNMLKDFQAEYLALIDQLSSMPKRKGGVGFLYYDNRRIALAELIRLHLQVAGEQEGAVAALEDLLLAQNLGSLSKALGAEPAGLPEIRDHLLEPGRGILFYLPSPDRSYLFLMDMEKVSAVELASEFDLVRARRDLLEALMEPGMEQKLNEAGQHLARLLLPRSIRETLASWKGITLVGLDLLGWTPFECLPLAPGRAIGMEKAVNWLPSPAVGIQLAKRIAEPIEPDPSEEPEVLMLVAPENQRSLDALDRPIKLIRLIKDQMLDLRASVGPHSLEFLSNEQATEERITRGSMEGISVLCLYAHGALRRPEADGEEILERPATLVLSPSNGFDGLVGPEEIEGIRSPGVVVLSACGAAAGLRRFGDDGINHLGGAFFLAGAHTVLLTRARLEVDSTAELTAHFMENLVQYGLAPDEALKRARSTVAASSRWAHPFFHSLLQVHGIGHRPVFKGTKEPDPLASGRSGVYGLLGGLLLIVLVVFVAKRCRRNDKA